MLDFGGTSIIQNAQQAKANSIEANASGKAVQLTKFPSDVAAADLGML